MQQTMERSGLGWFLPKFNCATRRLAPPHGDNMLVGNLLMHAEYKRRWRAVKDLRDVFVRFNQATGWYRQYNVQQHSLLLQKWLEYLHALNLEQFDTDVWKTMLAAHKSHPQLSPAALKQDGNITFCYHGMKRMFLVDGVVSPPHLVTGNKMRFTTVDGLLRFLFLWEDDEERLGWGSKPYRIILQKSFEFIESQLGYSRARVWLDEFFYLVRLTHWILPYPSDRALIASSKTSRTQGLSRRMMWFSAVFADPSIPALRSHKMPWTLMDLLWQAHRHSGRQRARSPSWEAPALIKACIKQGLPMPRRDETVEHWIAGRKSAGNRGFLPVWEQGEPPTLAMRKRIRGMSLDELDSLMVAFTQEQEAAVEVSGPNRETNAAAVATLSERSISIDRSFQHCGEGSTGTNSNTGSRSGSMFVPSAISN
jgi:hypothetical protein